MGPQTLTPSTRFVFKEPDAFFFFSPRERFPHVGLHGHMCLSFSRTTGQVSVY